MTIALAATLLILFVGWAGPAIGLQYLFGVVLPLTAGAVFIIGFIWKIIRWAKSPVPFAIPTVAGQQRSLSWIKPNRLDCPWTGPAVFGRMLLEVLAFRSLFRNTRAERTTIDGTPRMTYFSNKWLWLFALLFHYSMLVIIIRHARFFLDPVPACIAVVEFLDGVFQIGAPRFYMSDALIILGLGFLFLRRACSERLRYISLPADWFALFLLIAIAGSGICMRYISKVDINQVKEVIMGLATLHPVSPSGIGSIFFVHVTLVSALLIYFPFSKLMHMGGVFFSPTRNTKCNTRQERHVNPWNPPKNFHTYEEYEDEFRDAMVEAGLPVDKQPEPRPEEA